MLQYYNPEFREARSNWETSSIASGGSGGGEASIPTVKEVRDELRNTVYYA